MSYEPTHLTQLGHLKELADRAKEELTSLKDKVDELVNTGGEPNVIEKIKVNGTEQKVTDKAVDIKVPTTVGELSNDSGYQTSEDVETAIKAKISSVYKPGGTVTSPDYTKLSAENEGMVYDVSKEFSTDAEHFVDGVSKKYPAGTNIVVISDGDAYKYDVLSGFVDLSGYVEKSGTKQLSTEDYTTADMNKLAGIDDNANNYTHPASEGGGSKASGLYKIATDADGHVSDAVAVEKQDIVDLGIPETNTTYEEATQSEPGLMSAADKKKLDGMEIATDAEVQAMLAEVFPAEA